jgi:hypothetical protein
MTELATIAQLHSRPRHSPAREVQEEIRELEHGIDSVLAGNADLLARMLRVGQRAGLPLADGQPAIDLAIASLQSGSTMRTQVLNLHDQLRSIGDRIDLKELGWGDLVPSPKTARADSAAEIGADSAG